MHTESPIRIRRARGVDTVEAGGGTSEDAVDMRFSDDPWQEPRSFYLVFDSAD